MRKLGHVLRNIVEGKINDESKESGINKKQNNYLRFIQKKNKNVSEPKLTKLDIKELVEEYGDILDILKKER